jgi:hypothetical protein
MRTIVVIDVSFRDGRFKRVDIDWDRTSASPKIRTFDTNRSYMRRWKTKEGMSVGNLGENDPLPGAR